MTILIPKVSNFHHVALYVSDEFISTLQELNAGQIVDSYMFADKLLLKLLNYVSFTLGKTDEKLCLSIAMGIDSIPGVDALMRSKYKILYLFDAWPSKHEQIIRIIKNLKIDLLLVSSSQAAYLLQKKLLSTKVLFCPEACKVENYECKEMKDRSIDVLQLGRRYELVHSALIKDPSLNYVYQKYLGTLIFPTQELLKKGLSDSKLSVCFPKSVTHPEDSGGIETVTNRYYQSIASKCILIGKAPSELISLFGYNPVVELDMENPLEHVKEIIRNINSYEPLVEKNYETLKINHTWKNRWLTINEMIKGLA